MRHCAARCGPLKDGGGTSCLSAYILLYQKVMLLRAWATRLYLLAMHEELLPGVPVVNNTRWARFLSDLRDLLPDFSSDDPPTEEEAMLAPAAPSAPSPEAVIVSPSSTSMLAAPVEAQPAPVSVVTMPKDVNAKLKPLAPPPPQGVKENNPMNTRVASYDSPFDRFLRTKFAGLYDTGTPDLPEAAGMGLAGLGGVYLGGRLAPYGAERAAKAKLDPLLGGIEEFRGDNGSRRVARSLLDTAAEQHKLTPQSLPWFGGARKDKAILEGSAAMEKELAHRIAKSRTMPLKALGGLAGILGSGYLLNEYAKQQAQQQQGY